MTASGRVVSATNGGLALGLVIVLAGVALVVNPPAPPGISEFAPRASKPITKTPLSQGATSGQGRGACADGRACSASPTPTPTPGSSAAAGSKGTRAGVPSALQCFEWPDGSVTQTEDPQSPPCVASWPEAAQGNGGATAPGVTASEIVVAVDEYFSTGGAAGTRNALALAGYLNSRFMFYGRALRVVLPEYDENNDKGVSDAEHQRSAASAFVAARPFAATGMFQPEDQSVFVDHLTDHHVVTTLESAGALSTKFLAERSPYAWSFGQALDQVESNLAEMVCRSLPARGNARYGGTTTLTPRKFAVLVAGKSPDLHWLREGLAGCGVTAKTFAVPVGTDSASHAGMLGQQTGLMLQLRDDGYTSLIYVGNPGLMPMVAADNAGYEPEWISSGIGGLGDYPDGSWSGMPATQIAHLIGLGTGNKPLAIAEDPARRACAQADCGSTAEHIINGFYRPLMLLAAGIQAAGPRLTPESFRVGLESLRYPNPRLAGDLVGVARVGVAPGTRSLMNDFGAFSWNPRAKTRSQRGTYSSGGASCLVHGAKRWLIESWPSNLDFTDNNPCY